MTDDMSLIGLEIIYEEPIDLGAGRMHEPGALIELRLKEVIPIYKRKS